VLLYVVWFIEEEAALLYVASSMLAECYSGWKLPPPYWDSASCKGDWNMVV
jgi:hypothetical protein